MRYSPVIGIEVHLELKTKSKMFCGCSAEHFGVEPNIHTCPTCLGLPGALPVPNKTAIDWCLMIGLALGCTVNQESKFDRKNYFYPDLPKGYQISQYDMPFARQGELRLKIKDKKSKIIRINRVHMEEDTGKLIHDKGNYTLIDFNRSGVPLVEIVTEPDIGSANEAVEYLKKIQQMVRYLGVSDCDMEKGSMRCEVNISLTSQISNFQFPISNENLPKYKVEVKNINSFRFVKKAIEYEIKRQAEILDSGKLPLQETRGFSEAKEITYSQRNKEEAHDYRYFPEPDIPPIKLSNDQINKLRMGLPELPEVKYQRFIKEYGMPENYVKILTETRVVADFYESAVRKNPELAKKAADFIVNKKPDLNALKPEDIIRKIREQGEGVINDQAMLKTIIDKIFKSNKEAVSDYKKGKTASIGFLIGQVMRETKGKADPEVTRKLIYGKLK